MLFCVWIRWNIEWRPTLDEAFDLQLEEAHTASASSARVICTVTDNRSYRRRRNYER